MTDRVTANLPSRDFDRTEAFYSVIGFERRYRDKGWMILGRGDQVIEFFPHRDLDPKQSWFSTCFHVDDLDAWHAQCLRLNIADDDHSIPRLGAPKTEPHGIRIFYMLDPDGSLIRVIDNAYEG